MNPTEEVSKSEVGQDPRKRPGWRVYKTISLCLAVSFLVQTVYILFGTRSHITGAILAASQIILFISLVCFQFRASLRIHLSTMVVMLTLASLLVGQNVTVRESSLLKCAVTRGWPIPFYFEQTPQEPPKWIIGGIYVDVIIGLIIVSLGAYLFERFIAHRRAPRKT